MPPYIDTSLRVHGLSLRVTLQHSHLRSTSVRPSRPRRPSPGHNRVLGLILADGMAYQPGPREPRAGRLRQGASHSRALYDLHSESSPRVRRDLLGAAYRHRHCVPGSTRPRGICRSGGRSSLQGRVDFGHHDDFQHRDDFPTPAINDHVDRGSFKCEGSGGKRHSGTQRSRPFHPAAPAKRVECLHSGEQYVRGVDDDDLLRPVAATSGRAGRFRAWRADDSGPTDDRGCTSRERHWP